MLQLITIFLCCLFLIQHTNAQIQEVFILKKIDDDNIIIVTEKNEKYLLEKWTVGLTPFFFEGKRFFAEVSHLWVTIYFEDRSPIKWTIKKHLGSFDDLFPDTKKQKTYQRYMGINNEHWIKKIFESGKYIQLEDGSLWEVFEYDVYTSGYWLPYTNVYVTESDNPYYGFIIIYLENGEQVEARLISQ